MADEDGGHEHGSSMGDADLDGSLLAATDLSGDFGGGEAGGS